MKFTCYLCVSNLVILGVFAAVYAFTGFDALKSVCLNNAVIYRSFLAICGVSALFTVYSMIVFKPYKGLK